MRIVSIHNHYQQPGGEDQVFAAEGDLLTAHGHEVLRYVVHNDDVARMSTASLGQATIWNRKTYARLRGILRDFKPRLAHFHNTFPLVSPAAYYAARAEGVPIVQTLHNYRLLCPNALLLRDGRVCEDCLGRAVPWPGVLHACYRGNRAASTAVAAMLTVHRVMNTWKSTVGCYVALTEFARDKFIQGGLPAQKIRIKPNFVDPDPGMGEGAGGYALYVGRLSLEKGLDTVLSAWERTRGRMPLKIVGDGPLADKVAHFSRRFEGVEWLGHQPKDRVMSLMKDARVLLFPSVWYEGFPMVFAEACAVGLPVIASDLGGMSSLVVDGRTGLHFRPGDSAGLAEQIEWSLTHQTKITRMRQEARSEFENKYTAERNYQMMLEIYEATVRVGGERGT